MSTVDMSSVDIKGLLTCQELTKIEMSSVDIFSLDEKFLTCFGGFFFEGTVLHNKKFGHDSLFLG